MEIERGEMVARHAALLHLFQNAQSRALAPEEELDLEDIELVGSA